MIKIPFANLAIQLIGKHSKSLLQCDSAIELSCTFVEDSKILRDSENPQKKIKQQYWTTEQQDYFIIFWILKIYHDPTKNYFFSLPLKRNDYFKDLSHFLASRLGPMKQKTDKQCKSKFSSIKRKIKMEKMKGKIPQAYEFIDYLKTEAKQRQSHSEDIKVALEKLQSMESSVSEEVLIIRQMTLYQNSLEMNYKNNSICKYLKTCEQQIDQSD